MNEKAKEPCAVFLTTMRSADDIRVAFPAEMQEQVAAARRDPGFLTAAKLDLFGRGKGYFVVVLRSPEEVKARPKSAVRVIFEAIRFATEHLGADTVGLGSLTASVTAGGRMAVRYTEKNELPVCVTHGDTGSVVSILECLSMTRPDPFHRIAVVGAYGVIGAALTRILSARGRPVTAIGRNADKLSKLASSIGAEGARRPRIATDMRGVADADRIITVTSSPSALLTPDMVKPGAVVIDPAVPANVADDPGWRRNGNVVITNASQVRLARMKGLTSSAIGTVDDPDGCPVGYACLTETMVNAIFGDRSHRVGDIDPGFVETVRARFGRLGLRHATPRMFGRRCLHLLDVAGTDYPAAGTREIVNPNRSPCP